jgi:GH15 family glucan-1,4-alpha-glucosidase
VPRDLPLSNGSLLVAFDLEYRIRDIYFPYVGARDSTIGVSLAVGPGATGEFHYWMAAGQDFREVKTINAVVRDKSPAELLRRTRVMSPEGFVRHRYNPDGTLASSWHGYVRDGQPVLPIQEDETALVVWALGAYFDRYQRVETVVTGEPLSVSPLTCSQAAYVTAVDEYLERIHRLSACPACGQSLTGAAAPRAATGAAQ